MDRRAFELVEPFDTETAIARPGRNHDSAGLDAFAVASWTWQGVIAALELHGFVRD